MHVTPLNATRKDVAMPGIVPVTVPAWVFRRTASEADAIERANEKTLSKEAAQIAAFWRDVAAGKVDASAYGQWAMDLAAAENPYLKHGHEIGIGEVASARLRAAYSRIQPMPSARQWDLWDALGVDVARRYTAPVAPRPQVRRARSGRRVRRAVSRVARVSSGDDGPSPPPRSALAIGGVS